MKIIEFRPAVLPSLTRLINQHVTALPFACGFTEVQVEQLIAQGGTLWDLHYPDDRRKPATRTICVLDRGEVVAAAQWAFPIAGETTGETTGVIQWIVAQPDQPIPLRTLLHLIDRQFAACSRIAFGRCSLGIGWFGLPATWTHIIAALVENGYEHETGWVLMSGAIQPNDAPIPADGLRFYWNMNKPALEWTLTAYHAETQVGECQVWGVPPHLEGCPAYDQWATVEWVEVADEKRQQGIGRRLIAEQMRFHGRRGVTHFAMWVEQTNQAARRLNQSLGFTDEQPLAVLYKTM